MWRTLKQAQKNWGRSIRSIEQLRDVTEQAWDEITFKEINKWIDECRD
jgi:hypothetical protein